MNLMKDKSPAKAEPAKVDLMDLITGRIIYGGSMQMDGMHINLDNGTSIIVIGDFQVGILEAEKITVN